MEKKESKRKENWGKNDIRQLVFSYSEKNKYARREIFDYSECVSEGWCLEWCGRQVGLMFCCFIRTGYIVFADEWITEKHNHNIIVLKLWINQFHYKVYISIMSLVLYHSSSALHNLVSWLYHIICCFYLFIFSFVPLFLSFFFMFLVIIICHLELFPWLFIC